MFLVPFFDLQNFILLVRTVPFLRKIIFISSYTEKNNYFLLYELIQDLPYIIKSHWINKEIYFCMIGDKYINRDKKIFYHKIVNIFLAIRFILLALGAQKNHLILSIYNIQGAFLCS